MFFKRRIQLRIFSLLTALFFLGSTFGAYAQQAPAATPAGQTLPNLAGILSNHPEIQMMSSNLSTMESALRQIEQTAAPLYNAVAPTNMEAMNIADRIKAIVGNTKTLAQQGIQSYKGQVNDYNAAHGITPQTSFEEELGVGLNQLGVQSGKMPMGGSGNAMVDKLKSVVNAIKDKLALIINMIKAKITALAQKIGIMKKSDEAKSPSKDTKDAKDAEGNQLAPNAEVQYADTFSGKLSKGINEGAKNAGKSLKNSFSLSNLAVTTTVAVGTNLAIQMIKGEKPSFGKAARMVASLEFAGSVVGGALGAAGGQFASTLVKTFIPGPVGALVGSFIPVLTGSFGAQMGSGLAGDAKRGQFSIANAWKSIDKVDLVGSSIGSTIGMALGAPIPIIGPIIGGIVGGFLGSKIAKFVVGFVRGDKTLGNVFKRGQNIGTGNVGQNRGGEISIGASGQGPSPMTPNIPQGVTPVSNEITPAPAAEITPASNGALASAERKYYEAYLNYNKLVEQGKYDEAKKVYGDLKTYSDQYNALKAGKK